MELTSAFTNALPRSWKGPLAGELKAPALAHAEAFLAKARQAKQEIYPKTEHIFAALALTPFEKVKVVILGQDPYHGPNQAHGLSFSVPKGERLPPSLRNIFRELHSDLGIAPAESGDLTAWAKQGVLLLNSSLTVEAGKAGSHARIGWEALTDGIIRELSHRREHLVFVLWGAHAQKKAGLIDQGKHLVIESVHPSPLSASRGFFGSRPFSQINAYLQQHGIQAIDWRLPATQ